jgi:hypothetical protein
MDRVDLVDAAKIQGNAATLHFLPDQVMRLVRPHEVRGPLAREEVEHSLYQNLSSWYVLILPYRMPPPP